MQKVKFSGKIYFQAFAEGWLNSLAVYLYLCKHHSGKCFYFKRNTKTKSLKDLSIKIGVSQNSLSHHLKILQGKQMVVFGENTIRLVGNKTSKKSNQKLYLDKNTNSLKEIKELLRAIPMISNLYRQDKNVEKKYHQLYLRHNPFATKSKNLRRKVFKKSGDDININKELYLGVRKIGKLINRSSSRTIVKYKKLMKERGVINYENTLETLLVDVAFEQYFYMKKVGLSKPNQTFWINGGVYRRRPTQFFIKRSQNMINHIEKRREEYNNTVIKKNSNTV